MTATAPVPSTYIAVWCCDCGRFMRLKDGDGQSGVSHGICTPCLTKYERDSAR